ncbi:hypothetical protein J2Z79_000193 [Symbiobacterium terraclitae]|uniref:HNH endonuclease n=1 Tax=Symbiobacterium terraclitae TaxID=557451 RepID=A0ABS4JMP5_9FIRM|nr:hypothetical protein [Symbiobacterium terraclitae]MBP2016820.1 hypothetical protein [Symbiobacterium terraclitae]
MSDEMERLLADALKADRPVLVDPSEDELRAAAERLRREGRLTCKRCGKPIEEEGFVTHRVNFGPRLQVVVHLHAGCDDGSLFRQGETHAEPVQRDRR